MVRTKEEEYAEWLERLDIPVEETATAERLRKALEQKLLYPPTAKQVTAVGGAIESKFKRWGPAGVRMFRIDFPWGRQYRFGIKGLRGAFSYKRMLELTGLR